MNLFSQPQFETRHGVLEPVPSGKVNTLASVDVVGAIRRQFLILAVFAVTGLAVGFAYVLQAIPTYTSNASILIDAKNVGMAATSALEGSLAFESGGVDSQLQILRSDRIASSVARSLGLQNNRAFLEPETSFVQNIAAAVRGFPGRVVRLLTGDDAPIDGLDLPEETRVLLVTNKLQNSLQVSRVGRTYVFLLGYTDPDPRMAQAIVGQYVNAYLEDQLDSKFEATRRATNWMEGRIRELRNNSLTADQAVQRYRADNNLTSASGRLIDDQVLMDAASQLAAARSEMDAASARYQRLRDIVDRQDLSASLTELAQNPNVSQLRNRYIEAAKLDSDMTARYGASHSVAEKARRDMVEYKRLMFEELKNLLPGYQSDVEIAKSRVASIQKTIDNLRQTNVSNDSAMVKLRALDQESESLKSLYATFLQKYQEMQQQQSFPVTDARTISGASVPLGQTSPRMLVCLIISVFLGGAVGALIGALREWRDRGIRTPSQIRDELGMDFVANIPMLDNLKNTKKAVVPRRTIAETQQASAVKTLRSDDEALQKVIDEPLSQFSEAIRAVKFKINIGPGNSGGSLIGLISMFPDEGKSTIAKNLASSFAFQGAKTLLIDGDLRNPSLTTSLLGSPNRGLVDVIARQATLEDVLTYEEGSGLAFLPAVARTRQASDVFSNPRTHEMLTALKRQFDVVIIDFPPVGALMDAIAASHVVDGYLFVAHWGKTPRKVLGEFFANNPRLADQTLGVVLNKVDMKRLERYGAGHSMAQYGSYSGKYFSQ